MIRFGVEHQDKKKVLTINGSLTIEHVEELKNILLEIKENADHIIVNLANVESVDASCLQLLCSAHKTYLNENKSLEISTQCSEVLKRTVGNSGYAQHKGCRQDNNQSCLWLRWSDR
ncbi:MAG: STAS domain-containing protein [Nitrospiraceae bacterium]|nr:MAG: STAS domain-containing protein [Nitrospiraceae bacterium]